MKALAISDNRGWTRFSTHQAHYTVASRDLEREVVPLVKDQGLGLLIWSPLADGILSGKFTREGQGPQGPRRASFDFPPVDQERAFAVIDLMQEIAVEHSISVARVALAWLLHQDSVTGVIVGARRMAQLEDNLLASEVQFSTEDLERLDRVSGLRPEYPGWMLSWQWDDRMQAEQR